MQRLVRKNITHAPSMGLQPSHAWESLYLVKFYPVGRAHFVKFCKTEHLE